MHSFYKYINYIIWLFNTLLYNVVEAEESRVTNGGNRSQLILKVTVVYRWALYKDILLAKGVLI